MKEMMKCFMKNTSLQTKLTKWKEPGSFFCLELSLRSRKSRIVLKIVRHGNFPQSISQACSTLIKTQSECSQLDQKTRFLNKDTI